MFGVDGTHHLHFATSAGQVGKGLDEQLENFVWEHEDTRLIIVNTPQKVREMVSDTYSYASDYEVIGKLKVFADKHDICVLIVHHTRKQPPDPALESVARIVSSENPEWEGSPTELATALQTDMAVNRLTKHLNVNASRLLEEYQVRYENKTRHTGRRIRLTYIVVETAEYEVIE